MAQTALATAFVNVVPSLKGFDTQLKGQLGGTMDAAGVDAGGKFNKGFGGVVSKIGGVLSAAFAVGAVANFTKQLIQAGEAEVVGNKRLENIANSMGIFGDQADTVAKRLQDLSSVQQLSLGIDDDVIKSTQAKLLTFKNLATTADTAGGAFDRATTAALDLAAAGFGSAETNAVQLGKALQDPIKGITALARSGVTFTAEEKARIKTLVESNKIGEAQNLVLQAIETQVGGTAAATATGTARMQQGWANLKETIGLGLLPAFDAFASFMADKVFPILTNGFQTFFDLFKGENTGGLQGFLGGISTAVTNFVNGGGITTLVNSFMGLRSSITNALINVLPQITNSLASTFATLLPTLVSGLLQMIPELLTTGLSLFTTIVQSLSIIIPQVLQALTGMLPGLVTTLTNMLPGVIQTTITLFLGLVQGLMVAIPKLIIALLDALPKILQALMSMLPAIITGAITLFLGLVTGLMNMLPTLLNTLFKEVLPALIKSLVQMIPTLILGAIQLFMAINMGLIKALPEIISAVIKLVPVIVKTLIEMQPQLIDAGFQLLKGLIKGLWDNAPRLLGQLAKDLGDSLIGSVKAIFGIKSPSRVFYGIGVNIGEGLRNGIEFMVDPVTGAISRLGEAVAENMDVIVTDLGGNLLNISEMVNGFNSTIKTGMAMGKEFRDARQFAEMMTGGSLQSRLDAALGQTSLTNKATGMSVTIGSGLDPSVMASMVKAYLDAGYTYDQGTTIVYNAAPNNSLDAEQELIKAVKVARLV